MGSKEYSPFARMDNIQSTPVEDTDSKSAEDDSLSKSTPDEDASASEPMTNPVEDAAVEEISLTEEDDTKEPSGANGKESQPTQPANLVNPSASSRMPPAVPPKTYKQQSTPNIIDAKASEEDVEVGSNSTVQSEDVAEGVGSMRLSGEDLEAFWRDHEEWKGNVCSSPLSVVVKDPVQADRTMMNPNPPVFYLVVAQPLGSNVRRRYSDFEWLQKTLKQRYVGILVPPLPEKKVAGNFSNHAFIESRTRGLGLFIKRVVENPYMKQDEATLTFLKTESPAEWELGKKRLAMPLSARSASTTERIQNEGQERWIQALTHYVLPERYKLLLLVIGTRIDALEATLKTMISSVAKIVQAASAYAQALTDARVKFVEMKQANVLATGESKTKLGQKLTDTVGVVDQTVNMWGEAFASNPRVIEEQFLEALRYECSVIKELKNLLNQRFQVMKANKKAAEQRMLLEREKGQMEVTGRMDKARKCEHKLVEAENQIRATEEHALYLTKGVFFSQIEDFENRKVQAFKNMMGNLSTGFLQHNEQMHQVWQKALEINTTT